MNGKHKIVLEHTLAKEKHPGREVRHLLIESENGPGATNLFQVSAGVVTKVASGTEYETRTKAEELAREWAKKEGFELSSDRNPAFEPLKHTISLARFMGHRVLYDPRAKGGMNFTGAVPLEKWAGMAAKNGGGYEYAFTGTKILARPTLPPNHGLDMNPKDNQEWAATMQKVVQILNTVGPGDEFVLGGRDV